MTEDASPRHKFAIIQPHGDSHPLDPELVVRGRKKKPLSVDKFSLSERKRSAVEVCTSERALVWMKSCRSRIFPFFSTRLVKFFGGGRKKDSFELICLSSPTRN